MHHILVIDDESSIRRALKDILEYEGFQFSEAADGKAGLKLLKEDEIDIVLCDIKMPKMDGIECLESIKKINQDIPVIMITGHGNEDTAFDAAKRGAYDFIQKPLDLNRVLIAVRNALDKSELVAETKSLKRRVAKVQEIIGESPSVRKIKDTIEKVARTDARV